MFKSIASLFLKFTPLGWLSRIKTFIKLLPIILLVGATVFVTFKLTSCSNDKLKETIKADKIIIKQITENNKELVDTNVKQEKSKDITVDTIVKTEVQQKQVIKLFKKVEDKTSKLILKIDNSFNVLPKTIENVKAKEDTISAAQVDSLWETYCVSSPDEIECKV